MKVGKIITIEPKYSSVEEQYRTKVLDSDEQTLYIDYPVNVKTNKVIFLADGAQLRVTYISEDGSVNVFDTEVLGRVKTIMPMISLLYPRKEEHVKVQHRQFVRVESPVDVAVHSLDHAFNPFTTVTEDISAGGAAVFVPKNVKFDPETIISALFVLPVKSGEIHYIKLKCNVVRIVECENRTKNILALKFIDVQDHERQVLIRFCFERQLELRDKGIKI